MGDIYSKATTVLASPGPHENGSEKLFSLAPSEEEVACMTMPNDLVTNAFGGVGMSKGFQARWSEWIGNLEREDLISICNAWVGLLERSYLGRAWILQEVALAREIRVACGEDVLSWAQIKQLWMLVFNCGHNKVICKQVLQSGAKLSNGAQDLRPLNLVIDSEPQSFTIESVLENFNLAKRSDIRDHIYALMSLVNWNLYGCRPLDPHYGQSPFRLVIQLAELMPIDQLSDLFPHLTSTTKTGSFVSSWSLDKKMQLSRVIAKMHGGRCYRTSSARYTQSQNCKMEDS
jgi:hypothetical protein